MYKDKRVLVVGMARSGIAAVNRLVDLGAKVTINDSKSEEDLKDVINIISESVFNKILGKQPVDLSIYDLVVLSPGVPTDLPFIKKAKELNVEVIGEFELGYRLSKGTFYGITGTNGKTTTTTLTALMFEEDKKNNPSKYSSVYAVGNIGRAIVSVSKETDEKSVLITELSSFQLESANEFNVHIGVILNLTEDHLNRHKTMEKYIDAKCNIFKNQTEEDFLILNYDDILTRNLTTRNIKSKVIFFSRKEKIKNGFYIEGSKLYADFKEKIEIMKVSDILVPGNHNLENVLAASAIAYLAGIEPKIISLAASKFKGVEHRLEYVGNLNGVDCYNDSKGTNPDSSIVAVNSMTKPTLLIAGGLDKGSVFDEFTKTFEGKVKLLILLGDTKFLIRDTALKYNFKNIILVKNMEEAVNVAFENSVSGDAILLSPSCASWDMYTSFEARGNDFKECLKKG